MRWKAWFSGKRWAWDALREGEKPKSDAWDKRLILRSSLRVIPTPNPIPVRHPRARMRISRLITFASHGTAVRVNKSQRRGLFIVAKYKIEGTVYRGKYATSYFRSFVGIIFGEYSLEMLIIYIPYPLCLFVLYKLCACAEHIGSLSIYDFISIYFRSIFRG